MIVNESGYVLRLFKSLLLFTIVKSGFSESPKGFLLGILLCPMLMFSFEDEELEVVSIGITLCGLLFMKKILDGSLLLSVSDAVSIEILWKFL